MRGGVKAERTAAIGGVLGKIASKGDESKMGSGFCCLTGVVLRGCFDIFFKIFHGFW